MDAIDALQDAPIGNIPKEVAAEIFARLDALSRLSMVKTCKYLEAMISPGKSVNMYRAYNIAVSNGYLNIVEWLSVIFPITCKDGAVFNITDKMGRTDFIYPSYPAIESGSLEMIKWVHGYTKHMHPKIWQKNIAQDREIVEWALANGAELNTTLFTMATYKLDISHLEWLLSLGCPMSSYAMHEPVNQGRIDVLQWLYDKGCKPGKYALTHAICSEQTESFRWLITRGCSIDDDAKTAALSSSIEIFIMVYGVSYNADLFTEVVKSGSLEILTYLVSQGCKYTPSTFNRGILRGDIPILDYLVSIGCTPDDESMRYASGLDALDVIMWLEGVMRV